jgi:hypothetical protein
MEKSVDVNLQPSASNISAEGQTQIEHLSSQLAFLESEYEQLKKESYQREEMNRRTYETELKRLEDKYRREQEILQKKHADNLENVRSEERNTRDNEINRLRNMYSERERETATDLSRLETLHSDRLKEMQNQTNEMRRRAENATQEAAEWERKYCDSSNLHVQQYEEQANRIQELEKRLSAAMTELQESRGREETFRTRARDLLDQARILRAEAIEARHQAEEGRTDARQLRQAIDTRDVNSASITAELQIARSEVSMLEHELNRQKGLIETLSTQLRKYEAMIYGRTTPPDPSSVLLNSFNRSSTRKPVGKVPQKNQKDRSIINKKSVNASRNGSISTINTNPKKKSASAISQPLESPTRSTAYKWREGCMRSPLRCDASSLLLLPADTIVKEKQGQMNRDEIGMWEETNSFDSFLDTDYAKPHRDGHVLLARPSVSASSQTGRLPHPDLPIAGYY